MDAQVLVSVELSLVSADWSPVCYRGALTLCHYVFNSPEDLSYWDLNTGHIT